MADGSKLVLGAANFGMEYGYFGATGKLDQTVAYSLIKYALDQGIRYFDTAQEYGDGEEVLGASFELAGVINQKVITKVFCSNSSEDPLARSFKTLKTTKIYGVLFHDFQNYRAYPNAWSRLEDYKREGRVEKIGFSLYLPENLEWLLEHHVPFRILQVPYSIFDRRFEPYFGELKKRNIEIHARSIFLNGLLLQAPEQLGTHFNDIKVNLQQIRNLGDLCGLSPSALCLNFVNSDTRIDKLVIGVRSEAELQKNVCELSLISEGPELKEILSDFACSKQNILHPHEWQFD